jgi:hypothetical protein
MRSRSSTPLHRSPLAALLGVMLAVGLLSVFCLVVRQGVRQGQVLQEQSHAHADAVWRCSAAKGSRARAECMGSFQTTRVAAQGNTP